MSVSVKPKRMAVNFPNLSRSFDAAKNRIRFWGYDSAMEISFFVEADALRKIDPETSNDEAGYLTTFDTARERIHEIANEVYGRGSKGSYTYVLAAAHF